jgi:Uma2 family endonuclease
MSEAERQHVIDSLPSEFEPSEALPPEGDEHTEEIYGARTALRRFFGKSGRRIYIGTNLPIYYPGEKMFSPDVIAVLDADPHPRSSWHVSREGKGLDLAIEVLVLGHRKKDLEANVERYAKLGIAEYFVFDRPKRRLQGWQLREHGSAYEPILPQHGHYASAVLGLDLLVDCGRLRFYLADAALPGASELIEKLEGFVDDLEARVEAAERRAEELAAQAEADARRAQEESRRAEEQARRAQEQARRADSAERRLVEALAELERLRKR